MKKYFAVIGNPASHSKSPLLMNAGFTSYGIDAIYTRILLSDVEEFLLLDKLYQFSGCNVTAPFKEDVLKLLSHSDENVKGTGACNTIVKTNTQEWEGYNTDIQGALLPVINRVGLLKNKKVLIIGAGGAAKAVISGLIRHGAKCTIVNRTKTNAEKLALKYDLEVLPASGLATAYTHFDIIFNTIGHSLPGLINYKPQKDQYLLDANYRDNPFRQYFKEADERYIPGIEWLIAQAVLAFDKFTGLKINSSIFTEAIKTVQKSKQGSIFLVGPMGAGKTTVGEYLSNLSGYSFVDLDRKIEEKYELSIQDIFRTKGESFFRQKESEILSAHAELDKTVVSCGGGIVLNERNRKLLKQKHTVVLSVSPQTSVERINANDRPLLNVDHPLDTAIQIWNQRSEFYASCAHVIVNAENQEPEALARMIWQDFSATWLN